MNQFHGDRGAARAPRARARVPETSPSVGYDDFVWTPQLDPPLSVVAQEVEEIARTGGPAARRALNGAVGEDVPPRVMRIESKLIVRRSSLRRGPDA